MDTGLIDLVWEVYQQTGSKDYIHVISAYRSPATNSMLRSRSNGVAKNSQHTLGRAMDFFIPDVKLSKLREIGLKMGVGGVGFYPTSGSPFVHLDVGSVRHWPRMSRQELARIFPDGKTLHVPTDGKPLPRYEQALAEYKKRGRTSAVTVASVEETRKPNFFQMLAARAKQDQDDDEGAIEAVSPVPGVYKGAGQKPAQVEVARADPAPAQKAEETPARKSEEDLVRETVSASGQAVEIASLIAVGESPRVPSLQIPVPQRRPAYAPVMAETPKTAPLIVEKSQPQEPPTQLAALTPAEIEEIRRIAVPTQSPQVAALSQKSATPVPVPRTAANPVPAAPVPAPASATQVAASGPANGTPASPVAAATELALLPDKAAPIPSPARGGNLAGNANASSAAESLARGLPMPSPAARPAVTNEPARDLVASTRAPSDASAPADGRLPGATRRTVELALAAVPRENDGATRAIRQLAALENTGKAGASGSTGTAVSSPAAEQGSRLSEVARTDRPAPSGNRPPVKLAPVKLAQVQTKEKVDAGRYALAATRSLESVADISAPGYALAPAVDDRTMMVAAFVQARLQAKRHFDTNAPATLPGIRFER